MSNYTKSTNFATKDNLTPGDPLKVVRGTEIDTEFNNIATAVATKTDNSAAAITGGSITGITDLAIADGGTGASTATAALNNLLPSQTSNANKYLQTDGTNATWDAVTLSTADITGTLPVANGGTGVTSSTGTGSVVLSNSPTLVTPALGTPASGTATNLTGLPISTGVSGLGTGVATFLGTPSSANLASAVSDETGSGALVFANSPTLVTPTLGTPASATLTNATGLPIATGVSGLGTGIATALAVNTGSAGAPVLFNGALGTPSSGTVTNLTGTASININGTVGATTAAAGAFTTLAASGAVTLSGGTANGVTYLNGSKVLTSGSALTFDGTNLGVGGAAGNSTNYSTITARGTTGGIYEFNAGATLQSYILGNSSELRLQTQSTQAITFVPNGTEGMRLTSTGLGIGTSSPDSKLVIAGYTGGSYNTAFNNGGQNNFIVQGTSGYTMFRKADSTELMRLDSAGNLGLGVTPSAWTGNRKVIAIGGTVSALNYASLYGENAYNCYTNGTNYLYQNTGYAGEFNFHLDTAGGFSWKLAASGTAGNAISFTQAMTLDASGNLLVGTTNSSGSAGLGFKVLANATGAAATAVTDQSTNGGQTNYNYYSTGAGAYRFYVGAGGTVYATSTTITAISDQRLKENIRDLDDGLDVVMALKPRKFDWKQGKGQDIKNARGFIAQEFETVLPDMVETWRDPAPEGEEPYKAINANLIPTLVKALQEQQAIIESLKARLDAANL